MFDIIPLILILIGLAVIVIIVVGKFSILANLDVNSIQAEREAKFKERIVSNRIKRSFLKYYNKLARLSGPVGGTVSGFFKWLYAKLVDFKENYNKENASGKTDRETIDKLFSEAEDLLNEEKFDEAEQKYIEIISQDSKNDKAFRELGGLYARRKDFNEAKQSYEHALRLLEQKETSASEPEKAESPSGINADTISAGVYFDLAGVCRAMEKPADALACVNKALRLEPNNPRYLDTLLEISIINKDKISALNALEKIRAVNPENQKLSEWEKMINEL